MRNVYTKIKLHWKQILKYTTLIGLSLFNLRVMYSGVINILAAKDGGFIKLIDANASEWYYRSEELLIFRDQLYFGIFLLSLMLSLIYHRKTIVSLFFQLFPIVSISLYQIIYKELVL